MDQRVEERLDKIHRQIESLATIEKDSLYLEAHEKVLFSQLYLKSEGKNVEERKARVYSSKDWVNFIKGHTQTKTLYNEAKRRYELKLNAFYAELAQSKIEATAIRGGVG